jgi:hypothetical protein
MDKYEIYPDGQDGFVVQVTAGPRDIHIHSVTFDTTADARAWISEQQRRSSPREQK